VQVFTEACEDVLSIEAVIRMPFPELPRADEYVCPIRHDPHDRFSL